MTEITTGALRYMTADSFTAAGGISHGFTTRFGGVSSGIYRSLNLGIHRGDTGDAVNRNFDIICSALNMDPRQLVFSKQVHEDTVRTATFRDGGKGLFLPIDYTADGLITNERGLPLIIFTADCIPILLYDPVSRCIGAVHSGWRGTSLGIVSKAISKMCTAFGANPEHILAAIGPGICSKCFETDADVPAAMHSALGEAATQYIEKAGTKWHVDLSGLNFLWLRRAGLPMQNITVSEDCTACRCDKYWSHRVTKGIRGSQAALIQLL